MILNSLFKKLFNRVTFTKVVIIFVVGLCSRIFINYFYGVNVFVDYTNLISLYYYGFLSLFVVFINEVVSYFELDIFALFGSFISFIFRFIMCFIYSLCNFFGHLFFGERYFTLGNVPPSFDGKDINHKGITILKKLRDGDVVRSGYVETEGDRIQAEGRRRRREEYYAAIRRRAQAFSGGHHSSGRNVDESEFNTSLLQKLKCRVYWYSYGQFGSNYNNYYDFKNSLDHNVSFRQSIKNRFK